MGVKINSILLSFVELILSIVSLIVFVLFLVPVLILIFIPLYLWRIILIVYVKCFKRDFLRILDGKNPVLAVDDTYGRPLCTIVGMGAFDGADIENCIQFVDNSVNILDPITEKFVYPEAHQYFEEWFGFFWWKWEENFNVRDHILVWEENNGNPISEKEFMEIIGVLEAKPFVRNKSPWEVTLVKNVMLKGVPSPENPKTAVIFRFQHGFADGIAMMQVFMKCVFEDSFSKVVRPAYIERNACQKRLRKLLAAFQLPYQFFKQSVVALDINDWHLPENKLSRKIYKAWSSRIPVATIKDIKTRYNVGFTSVLVAVISGALRNMMIKYNVNVPRKMHAILPLPWPKHPPKFCNHWSYGFLELPVGTADGRGRLRKTHRYIETMKQSITPAVNFFVLSFFNLLPIWLIKRATATNYLPTVILSNFPGPPSDSHGAGGYPLVDCMFTGGPLRGNIGISICILSYDGALRIVAGVDSSIFPTQEMTDELIHSIEHEFVRLREEEKVV